MGLTRFGVKMVGSVKRLFRVRTTPANVIQGILDSAVSIAERVVAGYSVSMGLNAWLKMVYANVLLTGKEVSIVLSKHKTEQILRL